LQLDPAEVVMVAAHNDDLIAARNCGLGTAFIPRPTEYGPEQEKDLSPSENWNFIVKSIAELTN